MAQSNFLERIAAGQILVADGATGTNLQARGLQQGKLPEAWLFERPEEILRLHQDFLRAGADILLTCTFGAGPLHLEAAGMAGRAEEMNRKAAALARQAIENDPSASSKSVLVGGSMGPCGQLLKPYGPLDEEQVYSSYAEQARSLTEAGVDLLVIESQFDLDEAGLGLKAARSASLLPIVVSFSYDRGTRSMMGVKPAQMAAALGAASEFTSLGADVLGINCGRSLEDNMQALKELRAATHLPIWFKPNAGMPKLEPLGKAVYEVKPEKMGAATPEWIALGAKVVGGCCGTSPEHLREIAKGAKRSKNLIGAS